MLLLVATMSVAVAGCSSDDDEDGGGSGGSGITGSYCSYGADLMVDFHFIRLGFPFSAGIRYARTAAPANGTQDHVGLLFNISL